MKPVLSILAALAVFVGDAHAFYDPSGGKWLTRDPIGEAGGENLYAFARNDPVNNVDPLGLAPMVYAWTDSDGRRQFRIADSYDVSYLGFDRAVVAGDVAPRGLSIGLHVPVGDSPLPALRGESIRMRAGNEVADLANAFASAAPALFMIGSGAVPDIGEGIDLVTLFAAEASGSERWLSAGSLALSAATFGLSPNFGAPARMIDDLAAVNAHSFDGFYDAIGHLPGGSANKILSQNLGDELDQFLVRDFGMLLTENPVASRSYARLQDAGVSVTLDFGTAPPGVFGTFSRAENAVTIFARNNVTAAESVSTMVHEARHLRTGQTMPRLFNTQYDEFLTFRREFLFKHGRRPMLAERAAIWRNVQRLYPHLSVGRSPF